MNNKTKTSREYLYKHKSKYFIKLYILCLFFSEFESDSRQAVQPVAGLVLAFNFVPI